MQKKSQLADSNCILLYWGQIGLLCCLFWSGWHCVVACCPMIPSWARGEGRDLERKVSLLYVSHLPFFLFAFLLCLFFFFSLFPCAVSVFRYSYSLLECNDCGLWPGKPLMTALRLRVPLVALQRRMGGYIDCKSSYFGNEVNLYTAPHW